MKYLLSYAHVRTESKQTDVLLAFSSDVRSTDAMRAICTVDPVVEMNIELSLCDVFLRLDLALRKIWLLR